jgi:hypothetical protein
MTMAVFKKRGVYWIDYYVNGRRKRERIGPDKRLAEVVLKKRKVEPDRPEVERDEADIGRHEDR